MIYTIEKITTLIGARRIGSTPGTVRWLLTDSRSLCFPEETLFFALRTQSNDGHRYIEDLYRRGVRNFVVSQEAVTGGQLKHLTDSSSFRDTCNILLVPSPLAALQRLAERHRDEFDIPVVGITGSNGKTMVKEWLYQLLSPSMTVVRSPKSYNSQIGAPLSVWLLSEQAQVALFEAGISQPGEMRQLADIIQPTIGVLTSLGQAHQENFRSLEEKCMEKLQLFRGAKVIAYNSDDDLVSRCIRRSGYQGQKLGWSRENSMAPLFIEKVSTVTPHFEDIEHSKDIEHDPSASEGTANLQSSIFNLQSSLNLQSSIFNVQYVYKGVPGQYVLPFCDEASLQCSFACAAIALHLGLTGQQLAERMAALEPVAMRLEVKEGQHNCLLINDSYNSDVNSLDIALDFMTRRLPRPDSQPIQSSMFKVQSSKFNAQSSIFNFQCLTLILSDIYQSGMSAYNLCRKVNALCMERGVDKLIAIGPHISAQRGVFSIREKHFFPDTQAFLDSDTFRDLHDECILIKGARTFRFDRITELLEQKVHQTILEVNLNALVNNLNYYRSLLKPQTKLVCMVKADAYGAGAVEVAKTLQEHRVDYLAVAVADEGVTLRRNGITQNIMVMNPETTAFNTMFDYDLEPEVYSFQLMDALIHAARKHGITAWPVHIKLDTGMHRLGFHPEQDIDELIRRLKEQNAIIPRSVFSHFVGSDSDDFDHFSAMQFHRFQTASDRLQAAFTHQILRHMDNSAAIEHFPERQLDMCRLGLGLYGVPPYHATDNTSRPQLQCLCTLRTTILQLRHVPKEETVGYSRKGILTRDSVIAAIPIGYADGLNRHLGRGRGYCLVNGHKAPYVGNICMDVAMIDVTDIPCREGDNVEIFGEQLPVTALADILDTIPYEVMTAVSSRVKKVYFQ